MDRDDPEKRIADLERQLTELRGAGHPDKKQGYAPGGLNPEQVRNVAFSKPPSENAATTKTRLTPSWTASRSR